ncbi:MAG: U32 family peptidase [Lachnospiraceae bacterium]|nr:U32 family peptidase [Lachnospiraceae bacterium]
MMKDNTGKINRAELLAPAGNMDCLRAALKAGADAVYLGGSKYGARAYAKNFTDEEMIRAIDLCHLYGKKIYLTLNTLLKDEEIKGVYDYLYPFYREGLDGVIVQDMGVIKLLHDNFEDLPLHASTQMAVTDTEGVRLLAQMGIERVVTARELSLEEIARIYRDTGIELECFIHGALCYSYSGKCLFSSIIGGRSGNRGRCAGTCRLPFPDKYYLSAKDICTLEILPKLLKAGIASFKIEGRMKSEEYVGSVTGIYRYHLDKIYNEGYEGYKADKEELSKLLNLYTRSGNSKGYYEEKNGRDMITIEKPNYEITDDKLSKETFLKYTGYQGKVKLKARLSLKVKEQALLNIKEFGFENSLRDPIEISISGDIVNEAVNKPLSEKVIREQLLKTGNTEFTFSRLEIEKEGEVFLPLAALNRLRREGIEALEEAILKSYRREDPVKSILNEPKKPGIKSFDKSDQKKDCRDDKQINVLLLKDIDIDPCLRVDKVGAVTLTHFAILDHLRKGSFEGSFQEGKYVEDELYREELERLSQKIHSAHKKFYLSLPSIVRREFFKRYTILKELLLEGSLDGLMVDNYEALYFLKETGFKGDIIADLHLYAYNSQAVKAFSDLCEDFNYTFTLPVELNKKELLRREEELKKPDLWERSGSEMMVYGYLPVMLSAQCLKKTKMNCDKKSELVILKDHLSNRYLCENECSECQNIIYNNVPLYIGEKDRIINRLKLSSLRVTFLNETPEERLRILDHYRRLLLGESDLSMPVKEYTKGHLNRGVE